MSNIVDLFGHSTSNREIGWKSVVRDQLCPFLNKTCYKVRKSDPSVSIGTCTVLYGRPPVPIMICPTRLTERRQIFTDCLHLLSSHEPGNELHIVREVSVPGGSVDYVLASVRDGKVKDFVGMELQTLDTTGTVWPERQRLLKELGVPVADNADKSPNPYGMNWKMSAKTILVQMHHKIQTFEHVHKKLVLIVQDKFLDYMSNEFNFSHLSVPTVMGDSMHLHAYGLKKQSDSSHKLTLVTRLSTDADGIAKCLGLQAESRVDLEQIIQTLESKISISTLFTPA